MPRFLLLLFFFIPVYSFSQGQNNSADIYAEYDSTGKLIKEKIPDSLLLHVAKDNYACLYGLKNPGNVWIVKPAYQQIIGPNNGFYEVNKNEKWGILDRNGKEIISPQYDDITVPCADEDIYYGWESGFVGYENFYGKFIARKSGEAGMIDLNNKAIFPFEYSSIKLFEHNVLSLEKDGEFGFSTSDGFISEMKYHRPLRFDENGLAVYSIDAANISYDDIKNFGVIDLREKEIIPPVYDEVFFRPCGNSVSAENIFWVKKNGKYGFYDVHGKILLDVWYDVNTFHEDLFRYGFFEDSLAVVSRNNKCGIVGLDGKFIVPLQYDSLQVFSLSAIAYEKNGKFGLLGKNHQPVSNALYSSIQVFQDAAENEWSSFELFLVSKNGKYGIVNENDSVVLPVIYEDGWKDAWKFEGGDGRIFLIKNNHLFEFYNLKVAKDSFNDFIFESGLSPFRRMTDRDNYHYSTGVVKEDGTILVQPHYEIVSQNKGGIIFKDEEGKNTIIRPDGKMNVFPENYSKLFYDGKYLWFSLPSGKVGAMNLKGEIAIDTIYFASYNSDNKKKQYWVKKSEVARYENEEVKLKGDWGLIDSTGKFILQPEWDLPAVFYNSVMINSRNSQFGIIKDDGKILLEPIYDKIIRDVNGYFILEKDKKFGIASSAGKIISPVQWTNVTGFLGNVIMVYSQEGVALLDTTGKIIEKAKDVSAFSSDISEKINFYTVENHWSHNFETQSQPLGALVAGFDSLQNISNPKARLSAVNLVTGIQCMNYKDNSLLEEWNHGIIAEDVYWWRISDLQSQENENPETDSYEIFIDTVTSACFSLTVETKTCYPDFTYNNCNTETDFRNYDAKGDSIVKISLDDIFDPAKNYRVKLNALIGDEIHKMDDVEIDCTNPANYIDEVGENFIIGEKGISFYLPQSNTNLEFPEDEFLKVFIPYEKLKNIIGKKSVVEEIIKRKK